MMIQWKYKPNQMGHVIVASIEEYDVPDTGDEYETFVRNIGWHVQDSASKTVFFVPAGDCTYAEAEGYTKSLEKKGFHARCVTRKDFYMFIEDMKEKLDPIFYMAASCGVPTD